MGEVVSASSAGIRRTGLSPQSFAPCPAPPAQPGLELPLPSAQHRQTVSPCLLA